MSRILLIDDDCLVRQTLVRLLETGGHETIAAARAHEGLQQLATEAVDLVITDMHLDGFKASYLVVHARALRPRIPIIAISGAGEEVLAEASRLGATEVIQKPIHRSTLLQAVERCVASIA